MLSFGMSVHTAGIGLGEGGQAVAPPPVTAMVMGQSELEYLFNTAGYYTQIAQPTPGNGNLVVISQSSNGAAPVRTEVTPATVAAGEVNPAQAALSGFLDHVLPGQTFIVGDGAVSGTSRLSLVSDDLSGTGQRNMSDFIAVRDMIEAESGSVGHVVECWYAADSSGITNFRDSYWPYYFGQNGDGSSYTLGVDNIDIGGGQFASVDYCLWDGDAPAGQRGRGVFTKADTAWHILTPMPFHSAPTGAEADDFSSYTTRMIEPARQVLHDLASEPAAQTVNLTVGPSAHIAKFGPTDASHPDVTDPDGQIGLMWPVAMALLRAAGHPVAEPTLTGIEGPGDGSYADLVVDLPNGGTLTTLNTLRGTASVATAPHRQPVIGVEIDRSGVRHPVYNTSETAYPADHRGTVQIIDSGSGSPRRARVRVTPHTPFVLGDSLSYLRGQATAATLLPRDYTHYADMLIEHVPALFNASATYPFEGVAVRPFQQALSVTVAAPAFVARGASFDGTQYLSQAANVAVGTAGLVSVWVRQPPSTWVAGQRVFQYRIAGGAQALQLLSDAGGRMTLTLLHDGAATDHTLFYAGTGTTQFIADQWYHVMAAWSDNGARVIYVNGVEVHSDTIGVTDLGADFVRLAGVGAQSTGASKWVGDLAHCYVNLSETLDITQAANRAKFANAGAPVDLGANGVTPTGSVPAYYVDGDAPVWNNQGTGGSLPITGVLTPSGSPGV